MAKKKVTLSLDNKTYSDFQKYCEDHAIMLSKKVEIFMKDSLKNKRKHLLLFVLGIFWLNLLGAAVVFNDTFESGTLGGWTLTINDSCSNWAAVTTTDGDHTARSGSWFGEVAPSCSPSNDPGSRMEKTISTINYDNITFTYYRRLHGLDAGGPDCFRAKWHNGSVWTNVEETCGSPVHDATYIIGNFSLPASATNNANFKIRFECTALTSTTEYCQVDDILLSGNQMDTTSPQFSSYQENPTNSSAYSPGQFYEFNVTIIESNLATVKINFDGANYTSVYARGGGVYSFNRSDLAAGTYPYYWWANDTNGNSNLSSTRDYTVVKAAGQVSLLLNGVANNLSITYLQQSNLSASTIYGSVNIYLNGTDATSQDNLNVIRAAGYYNATVVSSGDTNHSSASITYWLNISRATSTCSLSFIPGTSIIYGVQINVSASCINPETSSNLYRNNTLVNLELGSNITLGAGFYLYKINSSETQNYSYSENTSFLIVNKATPIAALTSSQSWNTVYGTSTIINSNESNFGDGDLVYGIYRDGVFVGTSESVVLGVGSYIYTLNTTGGQNYSASSLLANNTLTISKATPFFGMSVVITPSSSVNYGTQTSATASEINTGDSDLIYSFYRGGSVIANPNTETLNAGIYNYVYNTSGGVNYTSGSVNATLNVSKLASDINLYINGTQSNLSVSQYQSFSVNSTLMQGVGDIYVYVNNTLVYQGASPYFNSHVFDSVGIYNMTSIYQETQNYFASSETWWVNVSAAPDTFGPSINIFNPQNIIYYTNQSLNLDFLVSDPSNVSSCWYNVDGGSNISIPGCQNVTFSVSGEGSHNLVLFANDSLGNGAQDSISFNVDLTGVVISISEPKGIKSSRTGLQLDYSALGNNLTCWYNLNFLTGGLVIPNTTIANCLDISFDLSSDGDYVLNLHANNTLGSFNFTSSSFSVNTVIPSSGGSGGGGGGGGSSGGGVIPLKTELTLSKINDLIVNNVGIKKILILKAKNTGTGYLNDCTFKSKGEFASWTTKTETKGLAVGEEYEFIFDVNIPENTLSKTYKIEVNVVCKEKNASASFNIEVVETALNFALIGVERSDKDRVKVDYSLEELSGKDQNVEIQFLLYDKDGKKITEINETRFVSASSKDNFETFITIPEDLQGEIGLLVNFNSERYSGFVQERVILGGSISGLTILDRVGGSDNFFSILIVVLFLTFTFFVVRRIRNHKSIARANARHMIHSARKKN